jgi:predicted ATPase
MIPVVPNSLPTPLTSLIGRKKETELLKQLLRSPDLRLLTAGTRDAPARQKSLPDTLQWSCDFLDTDEQRTFCWLAVFVGGCALEAATRLSLAQVPRKKPAR